ncbi:MAG: hypothetical protein EPO07_09900, partial [Verrucomicrobia bacterium]
NQWRVSDDFWDVWSTLYEQFKRLHDWTPYRGPGYWPDGDMLPLGNIRTMQADNWTRFTTNEQRTLLTTWCIARSPLIMGGHLPNNDAFTLSLLTNQEVIAVNQASANNRQLFRQNDAIAWTADVPASTAKYVALINASDDFNESTAAFASSVITRSTSGRATNIVVNIAGATKLYLVVTDGGDYYGWDHADWALARLMRSDGSSNRLGNLTWASATSGWNPPPKINTSIEGNALTINGTSYTYGIGTHAASVIEYDLPAGYTEFRALAGLDDEINATVPAAATNATIRFLVFTNTPARTIDVSFASLGLNEPVVVRDLWTQQDLGTFTNSFARPFASHASGLYKFTPVSALPKIGAPQNLRATVQSNQVALTWSAVAGAESYTVNRAIRSAGPFDTVATGVTGTNFTDLAVPNGNWFYSVIARQSGLASAPSPEASAFVETAWDTLDIGAVQQEGNTVLNEGTFQIGAAGSDIWNTGDAFRFAFTPMTGDATLIARVRQQSGNDPWEKAGVMFRESTNANSAHAFLLLAPSAVSFQYRATTGGGSSSSTNFPAVPTPYWLRLSRRGNQFTAHHSTNATDWIQLGPPLTLAMSAMALAGLAVTAHSSTTLGTAFFDQVSIRPDTSPIVSHTVGNGQLQLFWPATHTGWWLEAQTNFAGLGTNWLSIANSTVTNRIFAVTGATQGGMFFRLRHP